jgi:hypothetical protein
MPVKVDAKDRKLLLAAGGVFLLLIGVTVVFSRDSGNKAGVPSTYSTASGGAKAAYLVLAQAGYKLERWEKPLDQLPRGLGKTVVLAEPDEAPTHAEKERLKAFLSEGGHVIATGTSAGTLLPENDSEAEVEMFGGEKWKKASAMSPSEITRAAPEIVLAPQARWTAYSAAYPLYGDGERTLVVKYPYGRGEVLWWASATPLTNAGLKEQGNLEFLLACLGGAKDGAGKNGILWDEYIHGYRPTLASSIAHSPVKWLVLQLVLLGLAVLVTFSRRSGPIFKPGSVVRLSPIEFVETLGGLYEHAGTASVAVDICYQRFRYWLTRRLGVASNITVADLEVAARDRWAFIDQRFVSTLRRCESAKNDPYLHGPAALQLVQELDEYAIRLKLFQGTRKEKA